MLLELAARHGHVRPPKDSQQLVRVVARNRLHSNQPVAHADEHLVARRIRQEPDFRSRRTSVAYTSVERSIMAANSSSEPMPSTRPTPRLEQRARLLRVERPLVEEEAYRGERERDRRDSARHHRSPG